MRQHFVPKSYLRGFADSEDFVYTVNLKYVKDGKEKPNKKHLNNICYIQDHYNVWPHFGASFFGLNKIHELFVESDVLGKLDNKYQKIRDRLISGVNLAIEDFDFFIEFIAQLKFRNPYFLENHIEKEKTSLVNHVIQEMWDEMVKNQTLPQISLEEKRNRFNVFKTKILSDKDFAKKMNLFSLIQRKNPDNTGNEFIKQALLKSSWNIWEIPKTSSCLFITSDNPGYSVDSTGILKNTKFQNGYAFCLPLTSHHYLIITDQLPNPHPPAITKNFAHDAFVRTLNFYAQRIINERIIGIRNDELVEITDFLKNPIEK